MSLSACNGRSHSSLRVISRHSSMGYLRDAGHPGPSTAAPSPLRLVGHKPKVLSLVFRIFILPLDGAEPGVSGVGRG
jgi:hypothetical protein